MAILLFRNTGTQSTKLGMYDLIYTSGNRHHTFPATLYPSLFASLNKCKSYTIMRKNRRGK